jgi:hypothetical protein
MQEWQSIINECVQSEQGLPILFRIEEEHDGETYLDGVLTQPNLSFPENCLPLYRVKMPGGYVHESFGFEIFSTRQEKLDRLITLVSSIYEAARNSKTYEGPLDLMNNGTVEDIESFMRTVRSLKEAAMS